MNDPTDISQYDKFIGNYVPADPTIRVETNACMVALRAGDVPAARVKRDAGLGPTAPITFKHLREFAGFVAAPAVTATAPDSVTDLLTKLAKTRLWRAWVAAWDSRPECRPGSRVLVASGPGWGTLAIHDDTPPESAHLRVFPTSGSKGLVVELFRPWAVRIWQRSDPDAR